MKKFSIKLIKKDVYGLFNGETLITWSCSAGCLFRFLNTFSMRTVLLNRKHALIKKWSNVVRRIDNMLSGSGRVMADVVPVSNLDNFNEYQMKTIFNYYK